jgi:Domain of unknown function (DUF4252)
MKKNFIVILWLALSASSFAQTKTTNDLHKRFEDTFALYFYSNTLKMLNQTDDKVFDDLVKDIEKMKFLMVDKVAKNFSIQDYANLIKGYQSEDYENMMTARSEGKKFDVYLREENENVKGTVILVNDSSQLYILDIIGKIQPNQVTKFFSTLDENSDIAQKIKSFMGDGDKEKGKKKGTHID